MQQDNIISAHNRKKNFIYVVDNFYDEDYFRKLKARVLEEQYEARGLTNKGQNNKMYHQITLDTEGEHCQITYNLMKKHFNYQVGLDNEYIQSFFFLSFAHEKPKVHFDPCMFNCMIYITGEEVLENGTSFYERDGHDQFKLHSVLGFKENRAVLFDGAIWHASSQYINGSTPRYIMTNFIWDKEEDK